MLENEFSMEASRLCGPGSSSLMIINSRGAHMQLPNKGTNRKSERGRERVSSVCIIMSQCKSSDSG